MDITKDKDLVSAYRKEARELLEVMREAIFSLSPSPFPLPAGERGKGKGDRKAVYRLFRSCHTLKEISGCMGLKDTERMAGELLEIARAIKDNKKRLDNKVITEINKRLQRF